MAKNISEVDEGERLIPMTRHISLWICAFDPFPERALPYYIFSTCYRMHDRIRGIDDRFEIELAFKERFKDDYKRAEIEGEKRGLERGEKIGFEKSRDTLVSAMLGKGMSYDLISEISGLTKEQIMAIGK